MMTPGKSHISAKLSVFIPIIALLMIFLPNSGHSIHREVPCSRCHTLIGDSPEYSPMSTMGETTKICLSCHDGTSDATNLETPHVLHGEKDLPGGSFTYSLNSDEKGHNILHIDSILGRTPPGGGIMDEFGCLSCHDPHENGNYRNLKKEINGNFTEVVAVGDQAYQENIYISGIDRFCAGCHEKFHGLLNTRGHGSWTRHPVGIPIYGQKNADFQVWSNKKEKITRVEFPGGNPEDQRSAQVFCLSCHFAHAGPFNNSLRWPNSGSSRGCLECHSLDNS